MRSPSTHFTIVTPSYNQAEYLEATIDSVLSQNYPHLQYIIMDGGSTDGSVDIIKRYEKHLAAWESRPDAGPWSAVLKGSASAKGEWFNWLNSDDILLPGSLNRLSEIIEKFCQPNIFNWISCARLDIDSNGTILRHVCPWLTSPAFLPLSKVFFPQDSTFMRLSAFSSAAVRVPSGLQNIFDTVLHFALLEDSRPLLSPVIVTAMRWHHSHLTANQQQVLYEESLPDVQALAPRQNTRQKALARLMRTRYHLQAAQLVRILMSFKLLGEQQYQSAVCNQYGDSWQLLSANQMFLRGSA